VVQEAIGDEPTAVYSAIGDEPTVVYSAIGAAASAAGGGESRRSQFTKRAVKGAALVAGLIAVPAVAIAVQHNHDTSVNPANVTQSPTPPSTIGRRITSTTTLPAVSILAPPTESSPAPGRALVQDPTTIYEAPTTATAPPMPPPTDTSTSVGPTVRTSNVFTPPPVRTATAPSQTVTLPPTVPSQPTAPSQPSGGSTGAPSPGGRNIRTPVESLQPVEPTFGDGAIG
jgi:hypothetical protein